MAASVRTILLVEDHTPLRSSLAQLLARHGFHVLDAGDAEHALALFREHRAAIDLVIADMMMPGVTGLDLGAELERDSPVLKILYISGYTESIAAASLRSQSPDRVLLKPFTSEELLARIGELLG